MVNAMHKLVLLLCAAAIISGGATAASGDVDTYSFPVLNATTAEHLVAVTNSSMLTSASSLFEPDLFFPEVIRSEGFLLLSPKVDVWRAGADGSPEREASFNTSFTLAGASAVAFVVLQDMYPPFGNPDGFRGDANVTFAPDGASSAGSLAAVEVGVVRSYSPVDDAVGLNVTVTPNGTAPSRTVWIEYDAAARRLAVYVASEGQGRPPKPTLDAAVRLAGRRTTETAYVGFFAGTIRDIILGVLRWDLTVDRFRTDGDRNGNGKKGTSWVVLLLAVLGSLAATAAI